MKPAYLYATSWRDNGLVGVCLLAQWSGDSLCQLIVIDFYAEEAQRKK